MNIFILHKTPKINAKYHCDKHVIKMILESVQMLYTAHWILQLDDDWFFNCKLKTNSKPYKKVHVNHPCTKWVRESVSNYRYLCVLTMSLCEEYTYRYKKIHKCQKHINWLYKNIPPIEKKELTDFAQAMTNHDLNNPIKAYRNYYIKEKKHFAKWTKRKKPFWFIVD